MVNSNNEVFSVQQQQQILYYRFWLCDVSGLAVLGPFVLGAHGLLLLGAEVVLDVEPLPNLFGRLSLDHRRHFGARQIQQRLNVHVIRRQNQLEQRLLIPLHEVGIPFRYHLSHICGFEWFFDLFGGVGVVVLHVFDHFLENGSAHIGQRNLSFGLIAAPHRFDERRLHHHVFVHFEGQHVLRFQLQLHLSLLVQTALLILGVLLLLIGLRSHCSIQTPVCSVIARNASNESRRDASLA